MNVDDAALHKFDAYNLEYGPWTMRKLQQAKVSPRLLFMITQI